VPLLNARIRKNAPTERHEIPKGAERLLVVEDDVMVRDYLRATLQKAGYQVEAAEDGTEALAAFAEKDFDLVVSDVIMPRMNGMEMYREMLKNAPELRIIFISGYSSDIVTREGMASGNSFFLQKPLSRKTLLPMIRRALDG
jgi:two-component system, cell cycle sensor histidine kinase and response regulator CckA